MVIDTFIVSDKESIGKGMSVYDTPPTHGLLFLLHKKYSTFTMDGVKFPLHVYLYDHMGKLMSYFIAHPGDPNMYILSDVTYTLEVPC